MIEIQFEGDWISLSQIKSKIEKSSSLRISLDELREWCIKKGYLVKSLHATTGDIIYNATLQGIDFGLKSVEMNLKSGKVQSGVFANATATLNICHSLDEIITEKTSVKSKEAVAIEIPDGNYSLSHPEKIIIESSVEPLGILKGFLGNEYEFRDGQLDAIERLLNNERILVVQRTGWGKSIVYFIATKILRARGKGPTIIISPLLSLMRNQRQVAEKLSLIVESINSTNEKFHPEILDRLRSNTIDILLISPEQLANEERFSIIQRNIKSLGLFVVDEAHCISDWGHDFRPDYRRIIDFISLLPNNVPILATTATANDRVVSDISQQLGNITVQRGPLTRESLRIKTIVLDSVAERLAWLRLNLPNFYGSGIVYCLTKRTTHKVTEYLKYCGINAIEYNADLSSEERVMIEKQFDQNEIKCLVATVALGMGYDKPDISYVVHFQRPGNIVTYYQQIGRAGRNIENASVVLLSGQEDDEIQQYFIDSAFPTEKEMIDIVRSIEQADTLSKYQIMRKINIKETRLEKCLTYLQVEKVIAKDKTGNYFRTLNKWSPDTRRSDKITIRRYQELDEIKRFVNYGGCLMEYISLVLDDPYSKSCGKCMNCDPTYITTDALPKDAIVHANNFINGEVITIEPRKRWPYEIQKSHTIPKELQFNRGRTLCIYGDAGYGKMIAEDKYKYGFIRKELLLASASLINNWDELPKDNICICYIPSNNRPNFVKDFAYGLSSILNIPIVDVFQKIDTGLSQKSFQNSPKQYDNAISSISVKKGCVIPDNVLLIDDIVDSRWTLVAATVKLNEIRAHNIYPFTVANSNGKVENSDV